MPVFYIVRMVEVCGAMLLPTCSYIPCTSYPKFYDRCMIAPLVLLTSKNVCTKWLLQLHAFWDSTYTTPQLPLITVTSTTSKTQEDMGKLRVSFTNWSFLSLSSYGQFECLLVKFQWLCKSISMGNTISTKSIQHRVKLNHGDHVTSRNLHSHSHLTIRAAHRGHTVWHRWTCSMVTILIPLQLFATI
jgi:hypothetical protein